MFIQVHRSRIPGYIWSNTSTMLEYISCVRVVAVVVIVGILLFHSDGLPFSSLPRLTFVELSLSKTLFASHCVNAIHRMKIVVQSKQIYPRFGAHLHASPATHPQPHIAHTHTLTRTEPIHDIVSPPNAYHTIPNMAHVISLMICLENINVAMPDVMILNGWQPCKISKHG